MLWPAGADDFADAPEIGIGQSMPTSNRGLHPATWEEQAAEPAPGYYDPPMQSAWWKFTATADAWISFDSHQSTTTFKWYPDDPPMEPQTQLAVWIGDPADDLRAIEVTADSLPVDAVPTRRGADHTGLDWQWKDTSQVIVRVDEGRTYWIQLGLYTFYGEYDPDAETTYVLTVKEMIAHPFEIVVPAVGPFYNSPEDQYMTGVPTIVGGDDALRRESSGYIEFPIDREARYGGWSAGFAGLENWPPPPTARFPGQSNFAGVQISQRYYAKRTGPLHYSTGTAYLEGNAGGSYNFYFSTNHYPTINGTYVWDPTLPAETSARTNDPTEVGSWRFTGLKWDSASGTYVHGETSTNEGVNHCVQLSETEVFLTSGDHRYMHDPDTKVLIDKWEEWYGNFSIPAFTNPQYQGRAVSRRTDVPEGSPIPVDGMDYHLWFGADDGMRLSDGIEYAQVGKALRIEWFEWVCRWVVWEEMPTTINGGPKDIRRRFWGAGR